MCLLNIVICKCPPVFQLLSGKNQALLIRGNPFFVLDLGLDVVDGVVGLDLQGDGLSRQRFDENLHSTTQTEHQMEGGLLFQEYGSQNCPRHLERKHDAQQRRNKKCAF